MKHHPKCECDLCFADELERVAEAYRAIRNAKRPLSSLPGWDHAEQLARDVGHLSDELARAG